MQNNQQSPGSNNNNMNSIMGHGGQKVILAPKLQSGMLKPGGGLGSSGSSILNLPVLGGQDN